ncbi:hypothetical protein JQ621_25345 [Bradyrhizobium manausense]|uniref:hypothetical protein n=1 Tax=Bradyrhizobium manausense TaxID=989370 RepID=UPI001BA92496|nr:hypothetical protein [Bradyrhizobium manausense]MBR1090800.1 hypothetical protein [Bradyrhizobium manausense]
MLFNAQRLVTPKLNSREPTVQGPACSSLAEAAWTYTNRTRNQYLSGLHKLFEVSITQQVEQGCVDRVKAVLADEDGGREMFCEDFELYIWFVLLFQSGPMHGAVH